MSKEKGNVLVLGNSGVGKSTLINSVFGEEIAKTGWGTTGTTPTITVYESKKVNFRLIDTMGFEPTIRRKYKAVREVQKWCKARAKDDLPDNDINAIWFCVDGTARKLFVDTIDMLLKATSMWKKTPIIVVITKSYSNTDRQANIMMVREAFSKSKRSECVKAIIPVVAQTYEINDSMYVAPEGISELIDKTNEVLPEGIREAEKIIQDFKLSRKRALAHSVVGTATATGVTVGAVPNIPIADGVILTAVESTLIKSIASIYGVKSDDKSKEMFDTLIAAGTAGAAAKAIISAFKLIPGINVAASVLNAVVGGSIVAALGEGCLYIFEQISLGKKSVSDIEWVKKVIEEKISPELIKKLENALKNISDTSSKGEIVGQIMKAVFGK